VSFLFACLYIAVIKRFYVFSVAEHCQQYCCAIDYRHTNKYCSFGYKLCQRTRHHLTCKGAHCGYHLECTVKSAAHIVRNIALCGGYADVEAGNTDDAHKKEYHKHNWHRKPQFKPVTY